MRFRIPLILVLLALPVAAAPAAAAQSRAYVLTSDFATGSLSTIDIVTRLVSNDVASVHSDAVERWFDGRLYVLNRFGADNLQVLDGVTCATLHQFSMGNGSNPYDLAFASPTKAYVARYESADLWIVNPVTEAHTGTLSLAAFADADGIPEMDHLVKVGPLLFVSLQRLNRNAGFQPTDSSLVAVIDTRTDTVVDCDPVRPGTQAILLKATNPVTAFQFDRETSRLLIGCIGFYGQLDGAIEWIDAVHLVSLGVAITEEDLGGDIGDVVWNGPAKSYAIVSDSDFNAALVSWSPATGLKLATVYSPGGFTVPDAEVNDRGELYVCNSNFAAPSIHVFSTTTDHEVSDPLNLTLPPQRVGFDAAGGQVTAVEPAPARAALSAPWPNPARDRASFRLELKSAGEATIEAFDLGGRRVRTLAAGAHAAGITDVVWDLADEHGRRVGPGVYLVRVRSAEANATRRVLVVQ